MVKTVAQEIRELGDRLSALYDEPAVVEDVAMLDQVMDKVIEDCKKQPQFGISKSF